MRLNHWHKGQSKLNHFDSILDRCKIVIRRHGWLITIKRDNCAFEERNPDHRIKRIGFCGKIAWNPFESKNLEAGWGGGGFHNGQKTKQLCWFLLIILKSQWSFGRWFLVGLENHQKKVWPNKPTAVKGAPLLSLEPLFRSKSWKELLTYLLRGKWPECPTEKN